MSIVRHHVMPGTVSVGVNPNWYHFITGEDFGLTANISAPALPTQALRWQETIYAPTGWDAFITAEDFGSTAITAPANPTQGLRMQDTLYTTPNGWDAFITAEDFGSTAITAPANPTQAQEPI